MNWEAELTGSTSDLALIAESLADSDPAVAAHDGGFVLRSSEFDNLDEVGAVRELAQDIATSISGAARILLSSDESIGVGAVFRVRDSGKRDIYVTVEPVRVRVKATMSATVIRRADGTEEVSRPADPVATWLGPARNNEAVALVLRLRDAEDQDWAQLWRILDIIEKDTPRVAMINAGWTTRRQHRRFKHTANSVGAAGDKARHGVDHQQPPKHPMSLADARSFIDKLMRRWIQAQVSGAT